MTPGITTWLLFAILCLLLLTLPFVPAWREWQYPTDQAALPISANYTSDIDHFARRLHADVAARLGTGPATGYADFDLVSPQAASMDWRKARKRLIARQGLDSSGPIHSRQPLYVQGDVQGGAGSTFTALYATGDVWLGPSSEVHDWAHADGELAVGSNGVALRRVSSAMAITLGADTWFERMQAPVIRFGPQASAALALADTKSHPVPARYIDLPDVIERAAGHYMVKGNCALMPGCAYEGSLVVTGFLVVGEGTTVIGDIKARKGVSIARGASVQGAITCEKRIYVFEDGRAWGPIISETDILIGKGAVIGMPDAWTTVSGNNIIAEDGAVLHGAIWAREIGMVKPA